MNTQQYETLKRFMQDHIAQLKAEQANELEKIRLLQADHARITAEIPRIQAEMRQYPLEVIAGMRYLVQLHHAEQLEAQSAGREDDKLPGHRLKEWVDAWIHTWYADKGLDKWGADWYKEWQEFLQSQEYEANRPTCMDCGAYTDDFSNDDDGDDSNQPIDLCEAAPDEPQRDNLEAALYIFMDAWQNPGTSRTYVSGMMGFCELQKSWTQTREERKHWQKVVKADRREKAQALSALRSVQGGLKSSINKRLMYARQPGYETVRDGKRYETMSFDFIIKTLAELSAEWQAAWVEQWQEPVPENLQVPQIHVRYRRQRWDGSGWRALSKADDAKLKEHRRKLLEKWRDELAALPPNGI